MAFYNTFNELNENTGTFLTFSNYATDLTKWSVYGEYKVKPSKFVALDINTTELGNELPTKFNEYESGYTNDNAKSLFWEILGKTGNHTDPISCVINYVGDINIHSFNEHEGIGYSEIYCYIPNEASKGNYSLNENYELEGPQTISLDKTFNVNSIVVLYDVVSNGVTVKSGIPMGIYFTGPVKNSVMTNSITKFVYTEGPDGGVGTSYGLRICSRFIVHSSNVEISEVQVHSENYSDLSRVLSQIAISQSKMDELLNKRYDVDQNYKNLLSIFKNSKTNVPYIRNVNGMNYWFVNGKMVGETSVINNGDDCDCLDLDASIENNIISWEGSSAKYNKQIAWGITKNGGQVQADKLYLDNVEVQVSSPVEIEIGRPEISISSHTICYNLKAVVDSEESFATPYVKFVWPSYIGLVSSQTTSPSKFISESRRVEYNYNNTNSSYICYEYPKSFGELTSIKDSRDIEYINDFTKTEITKTFTVNNVTYQVPYLRYIDNYPANVTNYTLKFS